jgi:predicted nucleic acid-binding protein
MKVVLDTNVFVSGVFFGISPCILFSLTDKVRHIFTWIEEGLDFLELNYIGAMIGFRF